MLLWYIWECYNVIMYNILWICIGKVTIPSTCTSNAQVMYNVLMLHWLDWLWSEHSLGAFCTLQWTTQVFHLLLTILNNYIHVIYTYRMLLKEVNIYICIYTINLIWKSDTCIIINTHFEIQTCDDMVTLNPNLNLKHLFTLYV